MEYGRYGVISGGADDEGFGGGVDDVSGDDGQIVDLEDAIDLTEQALDEPEIAAGQTDDGSNGLVVGEVGRVQALGEAAPMVGQHEDQFVVGQRPVVVGEPDAAVELRVAHEAFFDAGQPMKISPCSPRS